MAAGALDAATVAALRAAALRFGDGDARRKSAALRACAAAAIADPDVLIAYHDCLLCLAAYPESRALRDAAQAELRRVALAARRIVGDAPARVRAKLANTGIAWTGVTVNFGWEIARWFAQRHPRHAEIDSFGDDGVPPQAILAEALAPMEYELAASDEPADAFVDRASAGRRGTRLAWLVATLARLPCNDAVRAQLFESMRAFVAFEPRGSALSRTFVRGLPARTFYHRDGLLRTVDLPALLAQPLPRARRLSPRERLQVVDTGRAMLASLGRETDAIALADPDGVAYHELGRGVAIALYAMRADRRSPVDSHVGMMLFKNRVPVGYGGGWPFLGTCRIGVNVFAPFRGGESALLFGQALRVYRHRFGVGRFVVEPSQFGGTDREGLLSGAFWFYWRLGFRPVEPRARALAADEWARLQADPARRTPLAVLRRFTGSDIALDLTPTPACEPSALSDAVTAWIATRFDGDRARAEAAAVARVRAALGTSGVDRWPDGARRAFAALSPLLALVPGLAGWPARDKRALVALIRAKGGDEFRFYALLARHRRLAAALAALAAASAG